MALVAIFVALSISAFHRVLGIFVENVSCCFFVYIFFIFFINLYSKSGDKPDAPESSSDDHLFRSKDMYNIYIRLYICVCLFV